MATNSLLTPTMITREALRILHAKLNFLGNVNLFHTRVEDGKAYIGNLAVQLPKKAGVSGKAAKFYVRPHQFEVTRASLGGNSFRARLKHLNPAGAVVKLEFVSEWGDPVQVEITQEIYRELKLKKEEEAYLTPKEIRVESLEQNKFDNIWSASEGSGI